MDIFFLLLTIEEKSGGLFDFDGTLPLTIFEFLVLMFILEKILYKPLSNITTIRIKNLKEKNERKHLTSIQYKALIINDNNMDFKLDVSVRDNKTVIYRADIEEAEVSSGAKNISLRPAVDYVLNQRFNVRLFYDSNITKPYTSQQFNTSFSNFGFSLRMTLN